MHEPDIHCAQAGPQRANDRLLEGHQVELLEYVHPTIDAAVSNQAQNRNTQTCEPWTLMQLNLPA